jgi:hypothetical protein
MLLHAWLLLPYVAIGTALLLAATVLAICLRSESVEFRGFIVRTDRRRSAYRPIFKPSITLRWPGQAIASYLVQPERRLH